MSKERNDFIEMVRTLSGGGGGGGDGNGGWKREERDEEDDPAIPSIEAQDMELRVIQGQTMEGNATRFSQWDRVEFVHRTGPFMRRDEILIIYWRTLDLNTEADQTWLAAYGQSGSHMSGRLDCVVANLTPEGLLFSPADSSLLRIRILG